MVKDWSSGQRFLSYQLSIWKLHMMFFRQQKAEDHKFPVQARR